MTRYLVLALALCIAALLAASSASGAEGVSKKQARKLTVQYTRGNCWDEGKCIKWRVGKCERRSASRVDCFGIYTVLYGELPIECSFWTHTLIDSFGEVDFNAPYNLRC